MEQLINKQIGQYQVEALLGEGGMGAVYRAHDLKHDRMVALKIMLANLAHKPQFRSRFMQEADAIATFTSPAIIKVLDTGTYEDSPYIIMEYIEGGSLIDYLRQLDWSGTKPTVEAVTMVAAQVAEGLSYAHQRGLIHRDIKPGNILLKMREGAYQPRQAVITDFGLAMQRKEGNDIETAPFMGSLAYMSPEQCENKPLDGRSDIYALGILLYQLTTGQLPFQINAPADIMKHLEETPLPPSLINPDLPNILETITLKAMEKKPGDRYQSAAEMAHALRQALNNPEMQTAVLAVAGTQAVTQWLDNKWVAAIDVEDRVDIHQTWTSLGENRLFITHQYEEAKVVGLNQDELTIGRDASNDIVLDDNSVSGQHIRLKRTPQGWNVSDLGSTNHSYLGERLLEYEQLYEWPSTEPLRVGPYFLRWQPFAADHREHEGPPVLAAAALAGTAVAGAALLTSDPDPLAVVAAADAEPIYSDGKVLGIAITPSLLELEPNTQNLLDISITNRDVTVKDITLRLEVDGYPPPWVSLTDFQMKLLPDETKSTTALVDLSQDPTILAGIHVVHLLATTDKGEVEKTEVQVAVKSLEDFNLDLHPSNLQEKVTCRLTIDDQSNFQNEYTIMGIDDSDALMFEFDEPQNAILTNFDDHQQQLKIAPRQEAWLGFRVRPRKRPLFGSNKTLPFKIRVRTPETDWQSLTGQVEISARITRRALLLLLLLLLLIGGTGYLAFYRYSTAQAERYAVLKGELENTIAALDAKIASGELTAEEQAAAEAERAAIQQQLDEVNVEAPTQGDAATAAEEATVDPVAAAATAAAEEVAAAEAAAAEEAAAAAEATAIAAAFTPTPIPNNPPTGIKFSGTSLKENVSIGTVIGEFTAVDPDAASAGSNTVAMNKAHLSRMARQNEEFTYSLVSGSGDTHNDYFAIEGDQLVTAVDIDFEESSSLSFRVKVTDAAGDSFAQSFTIPVIDTDDMPALSVSDVVVSEGDSTAKITVSASGDNFDTATVDYTTTDETAVAGTNYDATSGTLTWDKGDTDEQVISVPLTDNEIDEADLTFALTLSNAEKATIDSGTATVTITDDDAEPTLAISDLTVSESVTGGFATVTVQLTGASSEAITVDYATSNSTATAGDDYTATNGKLSWAAKATGAKTFNVAIIADDIDEPDETFLVVLSGSENAAISDSDATITISDNNDAPKITIGDVTLTEGDTKITVPVTMTGKTSEEAWVEYSTSNGNGTTAATADFPDPDFDAMSGRIIWDAGTEGSKTISIQVNDDDIDEVDQEFFVVSLYDNSTNVTVQDTAGNIYINDNDEKPTISLENLSASPVSEGAATIEADVTIDGRSSRPITVYYSTQNDTATAGADYSAVTNGAILWNALETSAKTIRLTILDDEIDESDEETFTLKLNSADNAQLHSTDNTTSIVIQDNDPAPVVSASISNGGVDEDVVGGKATISVGIDRPSTRTITVTYTTVDETAVAGSDYVAKTQTLTWAPGEADPIPVAITINNDEIFENDETFLFRLQNVSSSATIDTADTNVVIRNDDPAPIITIASFSPDLASIDEDSALITVTLISDRQSSNAFTVNWATAENSGVDTNLRAAAGIDYISGNGTLTWPANAAVGATQLFTMTLLEDSLDELDESFLLNLTSTLVTIDPSAASTTVTIQDSDPAPTITISDLRVSETDGAVSIPITMTGGSYQQITMPYTITNGTATAGNDYTATATDTLTWIANTPDITNYINLNILDDVYDDDEETILITLGAANPANSATITPITATLTITDNDLPPSLEIGNATIPETDSGIITVTVPVTLTGVSEITTTVQYITNDSAITTTATVGNDYTALALSPGNTFTWSPDTEGIQYINLSINGDDVFEADEIVQMSLRNASITNVTRADGFVTIVNDDAAPTIEVGSTTVTEGSDSSASIPVTLTNLSDSLITVTYTTTHNTTEAADYVFVSDGIISWNPETTGTQTIDITINNDNFYEGNESFYVDISASAPASVTTSPPRGIVTILDDEDPPEISINDITYSEDVGNATITATMIGLSAENISVDYATSNGTATAGSDYTTVSQTLTWTAGNEGVRTFFVPITNDTVDELSETINLTLSNITGGTASFASSGATETATLTITDNDDPPVISISNVTVDEDAGSATITATMTNLSADNITVNYATSNGTASAGSDYTTATGTLTWTEGGEVSQTFTVPITNDNVDESSETIILTLSNITGGVATFNSGGATETATLTIMDDDDPPAISISNVTVDEDAGSATVTATMTRSSTSAISVNYDTANGTATAGADYTTASGTFTWTAGSNGSRTFTVNINDDDIDEGLSETVILTLSNIIGGTASFASAGTTETATLTITDNDTASIERTNPTPLIISETVTATNHTAVFTITLGSQPSANVTIPLSASSTNNVCSVPGSAVVTPTTWQTGVAVTITATPDNTNNPNQTCTITIDSVLNTSAATEYRGLSGTSVTVQVLDDD